MPADSTAPTKALADFFPNQRKNLPIALTTEDVKGKTYIVTGATGGIGYELAKHLVRLEAGKVIIGARSEERGKAAKATIESDAAGGRKDVVEIWPLDLASYESVRAFGKRIETVERVDALVLNAGVSHAGWQVKEGNESHLTVNFISNYLLAFEALPHMQAVARTHGITPRLVVVGSMGAFFGGESIKKFPAEGILDDLNDRAKWESDFTNRYTVTKLLEHMAARQLASLRPVSELGVVVNVVDPGCCKTGLNKELSLWTRAKAWFAKVALGRSAEMGSRTLVHAVKAGEESHGKYLTSCEIREDHIPEWVTNETGQAIQKQIWDELLVKLDKIEPGLPSRVIADWA